MSYLCEKFKANFHPTTYHVIYIDDSLVLFNGKNNSKEIKDWLEEFQQTVNKAAGNQHLQFTEKIWTTEENSPTPAKEEIFQIVTYNELSFLDTKMSWCPEGDLQFGVFRKKGQQLKYIGRDITHTPGTLHAIPSGVLIPLAKLT